MEFEQYLFNQGDVINKTEVPAKTFEKYKDILPKQVLELWRVYGFSGISNGLVNLIDPNDYEDIREDWEGANEILELKNKQIYLIAHSAFGDLLFYVVKDDGKSYFSILDVLYNKYKILVDDDIDFFFDFYLNDKSLARNYFSESLFKECFAKLGALESDEVYGFVPLPVLGGDKTLEYAQKVKMNEYLLICAQAQM